MATKIAYLRVPRIDPDQTMRGHFLMQTATGYRLPLCGEKPAGSGKWRGGIPHRRVWHTTPMPEGNSFESVEAGQAEMR